MATRLIPEVFSPHRIKAYEGMFCQGNGYLHVRASFEEGLAGAPQDEVYTRTMKSVTTEIQRSPFSKWGTFVPLIMGAHPFLGEVMVNLPYFLDVRLWADGERLDMMHSNVTHYTRTLSLDSGELVRRFVWHTTSGCDISLSFRRFASMADTRLFVQQVHCQVVSGAPTLRWESGIDASVTTNGYNHFRQVNFREEGDTLWCQLATDTDFAVSLASRLCFDGTAPALQVATSAAAISAGWMGVLQPGEHLAFSKYTALATSRDAEQPGLAVTASLDGTNSKDYAALLADSTAKWDDLWRNSRITIGGNPELQQGLDLAVYHLLRCNTGAEERIQVCAKGFAGEAYYGRYFWDSEIYLLPFYLYTNPTAARSLLLYRYHMLDGARRNAARYHCRGARYPWQSGLAGDEQCSLWEYADNEVHVTADIAFAIVHYYKATDDVAFLREYGLEILLETARFWLDRVDYDQDGTPHLLNVMGPDEYSPMTRDNAYTNRMVRFHLEAAAEYGEEMAAQQPEAFAALCGKIGFPPEELAQFRTLAASLPIPYDPERELVLQSADFEDYAAIDIDSIWQDRTKPFGFFATQEKLYRSRCLKQADVILLMTLFPHEFTHQQVAAAYDYYLPLTVHDSSLSPAGHSIVANRLGREEDAADFLRHSLALDFSPEQGGAQDGVHIANCGCLWQLVVSGFAGLGSPIWNDEPAFSPHVPAGITEITFPLWWKGKQYQYAWHREGGTALLEL